MKYLLEHEKVLRSLKRWARPERLLVLNHFFWAAGTPLQKSQTGLLRTLLFQLLIEYPEFMPKLLTKRWEPGTFKYLESWSLNELLDAFGALRNLESMPLRICLFIDGLDEYQGEHEDLIKLLQDLTAVPGIKACVSSRPWKEFRDAFGRLPGQLQVHEFTTDDIRRYAEDNLHQNAQFIRMRQDDVPGAKSLTATIASRADGVFLWVFLVVRSLLRGLSQGDTIVTLQQRLDELPQELEGFFLRMIQSIEPVYAREMKRNLRWLIMAGTLPLVVFSDMDAPYVAALSHGDHYGYHDHAAGYIVTYFRGRVEKTCRDLVQVRGSDFCPWESKVGFLHRTVSDFLQTDQMKSLLEESEANHTVSPRTELSIALVANTKRLKMTFDTRWNDASQTWTLTETIRPRNERQEQVHKRDLALCLLKLQKHGYMSGDYSIEALDDLDSIVGGEAQLVLDFITDLVGSYTLLELAPMIGMGWWPWIKYESKMRQQGQLTEAESKRLRTVLWTSLQPQYSFDIDEHDAPHSPRSGIIDLSLARKFLDRFGCHSDDPTYQGQGGCPIWHDFISSFAKDVVEHCDVGPSLGELDSDLLAIEPRYEICKYFASTHVGIGFEFSGANDREKLLKSKGNWEAIPDELRQYTKYSGSFPLRVAWIAAVRGLPDLALVLRAAFGEDRALGLLRIRRDVQESQLRQQVSSVTLAGRLRGLWTALVTGAW
jgi:hypothetical protein